MLNQKRSRVRLSLGIVTILLLVIGLAWAFVNRQYIYDVYNLWQYTPSESVANISNKAYLSDTGEFYFYTSHAEINNSSEFNSNCQRKEAGNAILGCYANGKIYIYDVTNKELDGIKEVTASHEMLHAAWDRLSIGEQEKLSALLESAYESNKTKDLQDRMNYYDKYEQGQRSNELHSIVGTELKTISPELEKYYNKYFESRPAIVALHIKYQSVFQRLSDDSDALYEELTILGDLIGILRSSYDTEAKSLGADIDNFNSRANSGGFDSVAQFNSERAALVNRSNEVDAKFKQLNEQLGLYNVKHKQYKELSIQREVLNNSIDSTSLTPVPSL